MNKEFELFRPQKQLILDYVRAKGIEKVGLYSATTMIPLLVIYQFIVEDIAEYREYAEGKIADLKAFYDVKE